MEELRSTEILDKEIQSDARKKAEKILNNAQAESKELLDGVETRLQIAQYEKKAKNEQKLLSVQRDLDSSLPLEKQRFLVSYIQSSIDGSMNDYFCSLSEAETLSLFTKELSKYQDKIGSSKVRAFVYGLDSKEAKKELEKSVKVLSVEETEFNKILPEKDFSLSKKRGIILETEDRKIRLRLTLSEIVSQLEEKYREELYETLFDGGIN